MTCEIHKLESGAMIYVCSRTRRAPAPVCAVCKRVTGTRACDARIGRKLCSVPMCDDCSFEQGKKDYCPDHKPTGSLFPMRQAGPASMSSLSTESRLRILSEWVEFYENDLRTDTEDVRKRCKWWAPARQLHAEAVLGLARVMVQQMEAK